MDLILASASPQRNRLLQTLGIPFTVSPSSIDESAVAVSDPLARAVTLASLKAKDRLPHHPESWIIGCDTLVVSEDGILLEKPADLDDARRMLSLQSGKRSTVHSALSLLTPEGREHQGVSSSFVHFRDLLPEDIEWWITGGEWKDRSGGFQVEESGQAIIEKIDGDFAGVVGLPLALLITLMREAKAPFQIS